ncbi:MAG: DUF4071 domain-containing protein [Magnetococcales bacterium]|nr:DUF4071 domain-containing protein [Magnetococcales bacterium]
MPNPLCFVLMPFGTKPDGHGGTIHFDAVYQEIIRPAILQSGLEPLRADEEAGGGYIHRPMFERLLLCDYAVANLTGANANVFYELGIRHAMRPFSTVLLHAEGVRLPFDLGPVQSNPYHLTASGLPAMADQDRIGLRDRLRACQTKQADSPIYQLIQDLPTPDIKRLKTDTFRERVGYGVEQKNALEKARKIIDPGERLRTLDALAQKLEPIHDTEAGIVVDLFLSYRAAEAWGRMIDLAARMSPPLSATVMIQEQLGLALNRSGRGEEAENLLLALLHRHGPSSETLGILGRVYKDRWELARSQGEKALADTLLDKAIATYLHGFECDWRDAYPGINVLTLMELRDPPDERRHALNPVVRYAVERRLVGRTADYWDHATRLELAVLGDDQPGAQAALGDAKATLPESWMPKSTVRNLRMIREARARRGKVGAWTEMIEEELLR